MNIFHRFFLFFIVIIGGFLRFYNLAWDQGLYLHPDERLFVNASNLSFPSSWGEFFSVSSPLNPHMFYYGSFLLYLYKVLHDTFFSSINFLFVSRGISSFFSTATIIVVYYLGKQNFSKKVGLLSAFIFTFSVGSIQYAHFNTTESFLILLISLITFFSLQVARGKQLALFAFLGCLLGVAYATKVTGLIFAIVPCIAFLYLLWTNKMKKNVFFWFVFFCVSAFVVGIMFAPYQIIDMSTFIKQTSYMEDATYGLVKPPFVIIYQHTPAYLYQILFVFPFIFGFISFPLSILGTILLVKEFFKTKKSLLVILFIFPFVYFAWAGIWYAKFERYYLLLLPFLSILAAYFLIKLPRIFLWICLLAIAMNGILYLRVYTQTHTRILASQWMYQHANNKSTIATEYWDDSLPLLLGSQSGKTFFNESLHTYDQDTIGKIHEVSIQLSRSNYLILSSRRVYESILNNKEEYPYTSRMYTLLLEEKLGYKRVATFTRYPFFFSDDSADETFQSYDHPPVVIFKNTHSFTSGQLEKLIVE